MPRDTDEILRMMAPDIWKVVVTGLPQEPDDSRRKLFDGAMNALKASAKSDEGVKLRRKGRDLRRLLSGAVRDGLKAALAGRPGDVADKLSKEVAKAIETAVPKEPDMVRDVLGSEVRAAIRLQLPKGPAETRQRAAAEVLKALETANLLGMGGAGGRSWMKWGDVQAAEGTIKYVVCNGDESEPGTFKDRELLLRAPHLVIEGMMIGAFVAGASKGYVYIRHEYDEQIAAVRKAIQDARTAGVLGEHLYGTDFSFDLEAFVSPGGYICGEQSALIEAMEDKRAEPRNRPPELQTNGLWDKPTLLNNVETFAWVPAILVKEFGKWYAGSGVNRCKGRRLFSLSGDVVKPGVYEVANGTPLRDLIKMAGGDGRGQGSEGVRSVRAFVRFYSGEDSALLAASQVRGVVETRSGGRVLRPSGHAARLRNRPQRFAADAGGGIDRLRGGERHVRRRAGGGGILPQRIVWQVRAVPARVAEDRAVGGKGPRGGDQSGGLPEGAAGLYRPRGDDGESVDLRIGAGGGESVRDVGEVLSGGPRRRLRQGETLSGVPVAGSDPKSSGR